MGSARGTLQHVRTFNTAGPCDPARHYMLPARERLPEVAALVERGAYFAVYAPRQSGKTTTLRAWGRALTETARFWAVYLSCERAAPYARDVAAVNHTLSHQFLEVAADVTGEPAPVADSPDPNTAFGHTLRRFCARATRPLVLLLDEIDALQGDGLRSILHQLRADFADRPGRAPWSLALCGMRDLRDYRDEAAASGHLHTSSPFNVKVRSLRVADFSSEEIAALYGQHTVEGGASFSPEAVEAASELTGGQPWLVNALACEVVESAPLGPPETITAETMRAAAERLIRARATHLDSLGARLDEPRVRRVIEPLLAGTTVVRGLTSDDLDYVRDLGLVAPDAPVRVANPIYREVIVRTLSAYAEEQVPSFSDRRRFVLPDGKLDVERVFTEFGVFWSEHGELLAGETTWHEVAAQLVLMAYLQRVVNGGGQVEREYGVGRGRIDMLIRWPLPGAGVQREAIEIKVWRPGAPDPVAQGVEQLCGYLERLGLAEGWLAIFDRRPREHDGPVLATAPAAPAVATLEHAGRRVRLWRSPARAL